MCLCHSKLEYKLFLTLDEVGQTYFLLFGEAYMIACKNLACTIIPFACEELSCTTQDQYTGLRCQKPGPTF